MCSAGRRSNLLLASPPRRRFGSRFGSDEGGLSESAPKSGAAADGLQRDSASAGLRPREEEEEEAHEPANKWSAATAELRNRSLVRWKRSPAVPVAACAGASPGQLRLATCCPNSKTSHRRRGQRLEGEVKAALGSRELELSPATSGRPGAGRGEGSKLGRGEFGANVAGDHDDDGQQTFETLAPFESVYIIIIISIIFISPAGQPARRARG